MKSNKGFTLIEVLIAAVILFSALALTAELFKASSFSSEKAYRSALFNQVHPAAVSAIKLQLKEKVRNSSIETSRGTVTIFGIVYSWNATILSIKPPAFYQGDIALGKPRFGLYNVDVTATWKQKEQTFSFEVATW
jgi:prepilin-type N-terminal cleavage/methylation domain-containing protein